MNVGPNIKIFGIGAEDIAYVLRALVTRPGDIPGILRRAAARRRANLPNTKPAVSYKHLTLPTTLRELLFPSRAETT